MRHCAELERSCIVEGVKPDSAQLRLIQGRILQMEGSNARERVTILRAAHESLLA